MTKTNTVNFKIENGIRAALCPLILIVESSQAVEFDAFHFSLFYILDYLGITLDEGCIVMVAVLVADGNDIRRTVVFSGLNPLLRIYRGR